MKAKTKIQRLLGIMLALVMLVGLMPTVVLAEGSAPAPTTTTLTADFSTDPIAALALLNAAKTGTADSTWNNDTTTLTLNGVNFTTEAATAVKLPDGAKIVLNGDNTITGGDSESAHCYGIRANGSLTIKGDGTLNVTCGDTTRDEGKSIGIFAYEGSVVIEGGTITANGGSGTMEDQTGISGEYTLPANVFAAPAGMQFRAWKVDGIEKAVGDTITIDETTVIKALWEYINYNIGVTNGTASVDGSQISTAIINEEVTLTAAEIGGKVFDKWVAESGDVTFANANNATTTFTMPAGDVSVKATYATSIPSVAITGIDAPVSNTELDITAVCETTGVSTAAPAVTWSPSDTKAGYYKDYTASVTLTADAGYKFADGVTATVNNKSATSVTKNANGTLTVTYTFPKTEKHNIEITFDTVVSDGDTATNPTISSGYKLEVCFFAEDTNGDGDFINDKTLVVDKVLLDAFLAEEDMTFEEFQSAIGATVKTEFTGGCTYSVYAFITHSDGAHFDSDENDKATNAIIKVNNSDITDNCIAYSESIVIMPGTCVFTASSATTYTITFDAKGGSVTSASAVTGSDGKLTSLPTPTRSRYSFNGWYTEASGGTKVDTTTIFTANTTIYAQWTYTSGGGGGSKVTTNTVTADSVKNGDVAISPKYAAKGTIVTLKIEPDKGYKLDTVTVTDKNGNKIELTDKGNGEYTFKMPATKVNVETTFVEDTPIEETTTEDNTMINFFVDIPDDAYYYDAVLWAAKNGITGGMDDTHFAPDITCTRVQAITFLWRAAGSPMPKSSEISFEDIESDSYYYYAVLWALENGITSGTSATTFSPDDTCNRGQIVTFLWRSAKSPTVGMDNTFTDVSSDSYYADATNWAVANGITNGTSDTTFSPDENCTRGQIVTLLYRFFVK